MTRHKYATHKSFAEYLRQSGGIINGVASGIDATTKHVDFFSGKGEFDLSKGVGAHGIGNLNTNAIGKYAGKVPGTSANVYESGLLKPGAGVTLPGYGIIVSKGAYTTDQWLLRHEFGHILEKNIVGYKAFYGVIAPESVQSAATTSTHNTFWTETWANYLSNNYFNTTGLWPTTRFPIQNIS